MCCPDNTPSGSTAGPLVVAAVVVGGLVLWVVSAVARAAAAAASWWAEHATAIAVVLGLLVLAVAVGLAAAVMQSRRKALPVRDRPPVRHDELPPVRVAVEVVDGDQRRRELPAAIPLPPVTPEVGRGAQATPARR